MKRSWIKVPLSGLLLTALLFLAVSCQKSESETETTLTMTEAAAPTVDAPPSALHTVKVSAGGRHASLVAEAMRLQIQQHGDAKLVLTGLNDENAQVQISESVDGIKARWGEPPVTQSVRFRELNAWTLARRILTDLALPPAQPAADLDLPGQYWTEIMANAVEQDTSSMNRSISSLKRLLERDDSFWPAWLSLAHLYQVRFTQAPHTVWLRLMQESAKRAAAMGQPDGHAALGQVALYRGDWKLAMTEFDKALELWPYQAAAWAGKGELLLQAGLYKSSETALTTALEMTPDDFMLRARLGWTLLGQNRDKQALQQFDRVSQPMTYVTGGQALALCRIGRADEALKLIESSEGDDLTQSIRAHCFISLNRPDEALALLDMELAPRCESNAGLALGVAAGYAHLGRPGEAVRLLKRADEGGYFQYPWLMNDPLMKSLREDSRSAEAIASIEKRWKELIAGLR